MLTPKLLNARIDQAWMAAALQGGFSLLAVVFVVLGDSSVFTSPEVPSLLLGAALILGSAYGLYRRSRTAAVILCLVLAANVVLSLLTYGPPQGMLAGIVFGSFTFVAHTRYF